MKRKKQVAVLGSFVLSQGSIQPFVHEHWEEVYLVKGDMIVGNDENGEGGEKFNAPTYACRPPGVYHGPFKSVEGCVMFELHYFYEPDQS